MLALAAIFVLGTPLPLRAEAAVSGEIALSAGAAAGSGGISSRPDLSGGSLTLGLDTLNNDSVKASASLRLDSGGGFVLERAWAKARFPWFLEGTTSRFTAGLAPLSWGKGFLFNAADPVFGELPPLSGLSSGEYRIAAAYLASFYAPLGAFSFAEALWLPALPQTAAGGGTPPGAVLANRNDRGGGRVALVPSWRYLQSLEASWLHEENGPERGSLAAEGSLWADWYAAVSFASPNPLASADWSVSAGLFRIVDFPGYPVTLRVEALAHPGSNAELWYGLASVGLNEVFSVTLQGLAATGSESGTEDAFGSILSPGEGLGGILVRAAPFTGYTLQTALLRTFEGERDGNGTWIITAGMAFKF